MDFPYHSLHHCWFNVFLLTWQSLMGTSRRGPQSRYQRLEEEMERSNQGYIDQQQRQQQVILPSSMSSTHKVYIYVHNVIYKNLLS